MNFDVKAYPLNEAVLHWLVVIGSCAAIALFIGTVVALLTLGLRGPALVVDSLKRGLADLTRLSPRRIGALSGLAFKESFHRKALNVFVVFLLLFMFGGWFLRNTPGDTPAKPYIVFVLQSIEWIVIPVALLLACWGLPADIKDRSLHTVVTKPVRRSEIVLGRMIGYGLVTTLVVAVMSVIGYVWIVRQVPSRAREQLISRVPIYSTEKVRFIDRAGTESDAGKNVGDIWTFRSFIEGQTNERAIWTFTGLPVDELRRAGELKFEYRFEAFRSHKGVVDEGVRFRLMLVNPDKNLRVPFPQTGPGQEIREFATGTEEAILKVPRALKTRPTDGSAAQAVDLFDDLMPDGRLVVEASCEDSQQYLGMARTDLFIRLPDRPFGVGYFKAMLGVWLMSLLVIMIGTAGSCFLKGPVCTLLTFGLIVMGRFLREFMAEQLGQFHSETGKVLGGGVFESIYRLVTQMNMQTPLPEGPARTVMEWLDTRVFQGLTLVHQVIPDFTYFNMKQFVANGFDVPWSASLLPAVATVLGYLLPCVVLGYFSLQLRELEAK